MDGTELLARESIRDLVARYNMLGDSGRIDEVAALFRPDGCLETGDRTATRVVRGREQIRELLRDQRGLGALPGPTVRTSCPLDARHRHARQSQRAARRMSWLSAMAAWPPGAGTSTSTANPAASGCSHTAAPWPIPGRPRRR